MGELLVKFIFKIVFWAILIAIGWVYGTNHPAPEFVANHATKLVQMVKKDYEPQPREKLVEVMVEKPVIKEVIVTEPCEPTIIDEIVDAVDGESATDETKSGDE